MGFIGRKARDEAGKYEGVGDNERVDWKGRNRQCGGKENSIGLNGRVRKYGRLNVRVRRREEEV